MKLATFTHDGSTRIGMVTGNEIVDLATAAPNLPREMVAFLAGGAAAMAAAPQTDTKGTPPLERAQAQPQGPTPRPPTVPAPRLHNAPHVNGSGPEGPPPPI